MKEFDLAGLHDDHSLKAQVAPPLSELCVRIIAQNFSNRPTLRGIPTRFVDRVTELLPTTLPLDVTGPLIDDEPYWQRCASARWDNCQISDHGSSWKRLYFERNLADFLESFDPKTQDTEDLTRTLTVSKDYIFSLHVKQFLSHLDLEMLFQNVPTLCHLDMTYGVKSIGMDYERTLFGMKLLDVTSLAKALRVTETLTILSLPCNLRSSMLNTPPSPFPAQGPSSAVAPPQGVPSGSGRLGTPRGRGRSTGRPATASGVQASRLAKWPTPLPFDPPGWTTTRCASWRRACRAT